MAQGWIASLGKPRILAAFGAVLALGVLLFYVAERSRPVVHAERAAPVEPPDPPQVPRDVQPVSNETVRATPPQEHEELPAAYFGDVTIVGHTRDRAGVGIPALRVECHPAGFEPSTTAQNARLTTTSGRDGTFSFDRFPKAQLYHLRAMGPGYFGELRIDFEDLDGRHRVVVDPVFYERYEFFDAAGRPVDVRGQVTLGIGKVVTTSGTPQRPTQYARLAAMGFDFLNLPAHAFASIHKGRAVFAKDRSATHTVRIAGYEPVRLDMFRWPASRWPEAVRVTLNPARGEARAVRYRVAFPRAQRPSKWNVRIDGKDVPGPPYLSVDVHEIRKQLRHSVSARWPWFWAQPGIGLAVFVNGVEIPHKKMRTKGEYEIRPQYPDFALVTLSYPVPEIGGDKHFSVHVQAEHGGAFHRAWSARPGEARFRALPVGEYQFRRVWFSGTAGRFVSDVFGPVRLAPGHNELEWK